MLFALAEIRKNPEGLVFDNTLDIKEKIMQRNSDILDIKDVRATGSVNYEDELYLLTYKLSYNVTLPSSRSMTAVDVMFEEEVNELFITPESLPQKRDIVDENLALVLEQDVIDLEESVIDNILLLLPLQVLTDEEKESDNMPSGQSWSVLTEEQYQSQQEEKKKENNPFKTLSGLFDD